MRFRQCTPAEAGESNSSMCSMIGQCIIQEFLRICRCSRISVCTIITTSGSIKICDFN